MCAPDAGAHISTNVITSRMDTSAAPCTHELGGFAV